MNVRDICEKGLFDKVMIDGYMMSMFNNKGIEIENDDESLIAALENNKSAYNQGIGKLRINVIGDALNDGEYEKIIEEQEYREQVLRLSKTKIGKIDRYNLGYADILILKSDLVFPVGITNTGKTKDDILKLAKGEDELQIMLKALEVQHNIIKSDNGIDNYNIAILDRLYVHKAFRNCGISSWINNNIHDIIKVYGMIDIGAILLIPGDFSSEARNCFNMSNEEYVDMLIEHYKSVGYEVVDDNIMCKYFSKTTKKFFNIFRSKQK